MKFKENDFINEEITITRIHDDRVIIERDDKEYKVFMNNLIRPVE
jgi:hypothetical protein